MRVSVIGCGHVGLVTAGCMAVIGHQVVCADQETERIRLLEGGRLPIYEPRLEDLIRRGRAAGTISFTCEPGEAARVSELVFLCVGVPRQESGESDLSALESAARLIAQAVDAPKLVVERSTVPIQTGDQLRHLLNVYSRNPGAHFQVAANPQFLREGTAVQDFLHPERILLGVEDSDSEITLRRLYAPILDQSFSCPVHAACPSRQAPELLITSVHSAELIKHAANAFLGVKISYANVLADLCEKLGGNVQEVTHAMGLDPRIGKQFLTAGIGFGGDHLPQDLRAFCALLKHESVDPGILQGAEDVNRGRIDVFFEKTRRALWVLKEKRICMLGLAHKAGTDDIRGSPAIELYNRLAAAGASVCVYDPQAIPNARVVFPDLVSFPDPYLAAKGADALLVLTEWDEFRSLDWKRIHDAMGRPLVLDGRNLLSPAHMKSLGFQYHSIGRPD